MFIPFQDSPVKRLPVSLAALSLLALSGCSQLYDDTKGWGNDVEAWFQRDVLGPIGAEMRGEPYPRRNEEPALAQKSAEPMTDNKSGPMVKEAMVKEAMAKETTAKNNQIASADASLPAGATASAETAPPKKAAMVKAEAAQVYPQTAGKAPEAAMMKKPEKAMMKKSGEAMALHLSSNRSKESAMQEWAQLKAAFPVQLAGLAPAFMRTDLGKKGVFFRVLAGPLPDKPAAARVCSELKKKQQYCAVMPAAKQAG